MRREGRGGERGGVGGGGGGRERGARRKSYIYIVHLVCRERDGGGERGGLWGEGRRCTCRFEGRKGRDGVLGERVSK